MVGRTTKQRLVHAQDVRVGGLRHARLQVQDVRLFNGCANAQRL